MDEPRTGTPKTAALIVAAGRGDRFGGPVPKQFQRLGGGTVLSTAVDRFAGHPRVDLVAVVVAPDWMQTAAECLKHYGVRLISGRATRQESVLDGLTKLHEDNISNILISDAVRPLVPPAMIDRVLDALSGHGAVMPGLPVVDTLKRQDGDGALTTVPRDGLYLAQTPQGFRFDLIHRAHIRAAAEGRAVTDDIALAELFGHDIALVEGDEMAFKITHPADLERARRMVDRQASEIRVGSGFDVHKAGPGSGVVLCGVAIPAGFALIGHSDADVGAHAATDAILGAIGAGDIGQHFPPSDDRWAGADSRAFLAHAAWLVAGRGGRIVNLDVTLICERPRIGPHRQAMVAALAAALDIDAARVSVKATTSEGLGFTGRGEGIAAQATATIALPADA